MPGPTRGTPSLNADDDRFYRAYLRRLVGGLGWVNDEVAFGAFDPQTLGLDRLQVLPPGNHTNLVAGAGQQRPKITAGSACAENRNTHRDLQL